MTLGCTWYRRRCRLSTGCWEPWASPSTSRPSRCRQAAGRLPTPPAPAPAPAACRAASPCPSSQGGASVQSALFSQLLDSFPQHAGATCHSNQNHMEWVGVLTVVLGWGAMGLRRSQSLPACGSEKHLQGLLRRHSVGPGRLSCPGCTNAHGTGMRVAVHGGPGRHGGGLWGGAAAGRVPGAGRGHRAGLSCFFGPSLALDLCLCASLGWLLASCRSADTVAGAEAAP